MAIAAAAALPTTATVVRRGHPQTLHIYGSRGGAPVIVSSGDGGRFSDRHDTFEADLPEAFAWITHSTT